MHTQRSDTNLLKYHFAAMTRRSGRKTKAPDHFDPILFIRNTLAQTPNKNKRPRRNLLNSSNALQTNSPILKEDVQALFASTILNWSSMAEDKKRHFIDTFPPAYRIYTMDENGNLECPISEEFARNDNIIKRDVARFKRDIEAGFYLKKWQQEGRKAMTERAEGSFDVYIKQHADDNFGQHQQASQAHGIANRVGETRSVSDVEGKRD
jgi:Asx homology domain